MQFCPHCDSELDARDDELYCYTCETTINCDFLTTTNIDNVNTTNPYVCNLTVRDTLSVYIKKTEVIDKAEELYQLYITWLNTNVRGMNKKIIMAASTYIAYTHVNRDYMNTIKDVLFMFDLNISLRSRITSCINKINMNLDIIPDELQIECYFNTVVIKSQISGDNIPRAKELLDSLNTRGLCRSSSMLSKCAGVILYLKQQTENLNIMKESVNIGIKKETLISTIRSITHALKI